MVEESKPYATAHRENSRTPSFTTLAVFGPGPGRLNLSGRKASCDHLAMVALKLSLRQMLDLMAFYRNAFHSGVPMTGPLLPMLVVCLVCNP